MSLELEDFTPDEDVGVGIKVWSSLLVKMASASKSLKIVGGVKSSCKSSMSVRMELS